ncbi:GNAT family N-acetyltransferase [Acinetobacter sp. BSP-28]|uniref:GNAT family N-acetyltransferase n=1 Tax=Acinetobacter sp. BSP-28 TaxID=3344661 RepID=UPI0037702AD9
MSLQLETSRLILRAWKNSDLKPFYALNCNPEVMRYFPDCLTRAQSDALAHRFQGLIETQAWGVWAIELKQTGEFIGFTGLHAQPRQFTFSPCTEIAWRLEQKYWGNGFATEAATACLNFAFDSLNLKQIVAFTAAQNIKSQAVMQRLGMQFKDYFNHPALDDSSPLQRHVLYQIAAAQFSKRKE